MTDPCAAAPVEPHRPALVVSAALLGDALQLSDGFYGLAPITLVDRRPGARLAGADRAAGAERGAPGSRPGGGAGDPGGGGDAAAADQRRADRLLLQAPDAVAASRLRAGTRRRRPAGSSPPRWPGRAAGCAWPRPPRWWPPRRGWACSPTVARRPRPSTSSRCTTTPLRRSAAARVPYSMTFTDIYAGTEQFYPPGMAVDGRVLYGFPYPPLSLAMAWPGHLAGDFRYAELAALVAAAAFAVAAGRASAVAIGAAAILLFTPRAFFALEQAWTEPFAIVWVAGAIWAAATRRPLVAAAFLGLAAATKQYLALAVPAAWLLGDRSRHQPARGRHHRGRRRDRPAAGAGRSLRLPPQRRDGPGARSPPHGLAEPGGDVGRADRGADVRRRVCGPGDGGGGPGGLAGPGDAVGIWPPRWRSRSSPPSPSARRRSATTT